MDEFNEYLDPYEQLPVLGNCSDFTVDQYNSEFSNSIENYSLFNQNMRSFHGNSYLLESFLEAINQKFHSIVLTETWNSVKNVNLCFIQNYDGVHNFRRNLHLHGGIGGGVSIFCNSFLYSMKKMNDLCFCNEAIESCVAELTLKKDVSLKHFIVAIYRPPNGNIDEFVTTLNLVLSNEALKDKKIFIAGDMNINIMAQTNESDNYLNMLHSFFFLPTITNPTRYNTNTATNLDHIFINSLIPFSSAVIATSLSDHHGTSITLKLFDFDSNTRTNSKKTFRPYSDENLNRFSNKLLDINWDAFLDVEDVNCQWNSFIDFVDKLYVKCFPLKTKIISEKRLKNPWITDSTLSKIRQKSENYRLRENGLMSFADHNRRKNRLNKEIKRDKNVYFQNLFTNTRADMKKSWNTLRSILGTKNKNDGISKIFLDDKNDEEKQVTINRFNDFFSSIGTLLSNNFESNLNIQHTNDIAPNNNSYYLFRVEESEIISIITQLKLTKSQVDSMPLLILKKVSNILVKPLTILVNKSFENGVFPDCLKIARVTPLHKMGEFSNPTNYRPISSLPFYSKIIEKLMVKRLMSFCKKFSIIAPQQFGFQPGISTCNALNSLIDLIYNSLNSKMHHVITLIDIRKAFDCVNHRILLTKLEAYGIRGIPLRWFESYLLNRRCFIQIENFKSDVNTFNIGVPQGSVLGPLLFLLYINDLPNLRNNFETVLFADDTTISTSGHTSDDLIEKTNHALATISKWTDSNELTLNTCKTELMLISNRTFESRADFKLKDEVLIPTQSCKFLGVHLDNKLTFKNHIDHVTSKISKHTGILFKIRDLLPLKSRLDYYFAFIYPYLMYNVIVWGSSSAVHLNPLIIQHKRTIRTISNANVRDNSSPLFKELKLLKFDDVYRYYLLIYMFKALKNGEFRVSHDRITRQVNSAQPNFQTKSYPTLYLIFRCCYLGFITARILFNI